MHPLIRLVLQRLLLGLGTLWVVLTMIFLAVQLLPGDLAEVILGQETSPEAVAAIRRDLGLDRPLHERYVEWIVNLLHGDLDVAEMLGMRMANTLFLAALAAVIAVPLAVSMGILAALYRK